PARNSKAGKKESMGRRLSQLCPPCATPSSNSSLDYRRSDARIVENGFATSSGMNKSAKVVLGRVLINRDCSAIADCRKRRRADRAEGALRHTTTRRGALGASCIQQRPAPHVSGQIGLRHKASTTARGASGRNPYQGVLQTMALHVAHDMSYRS